MFLFWAKIVLVLMSEAFMCDEWCTMLLRYCMDNLRKPYKLVLLDKSNDWKLGDLGFRLSSEVCRLRFINLFPGFCRLLLRLLLRQ